MGNIQIPIPLGHGIFPRHTPNPPGRALPSRANEQGHAQSEATSIAISPHTSVYQIDSSRLSHARQRVQHNTILSYTMRQDKHARTHTHRDLLSTSKNHKCETKHCPDWAGCSAVLVEFPTQVQLHYTTLYYIWANRQPTDSHVFQCEIPGPIPRA